MLGQLDVRVYPDPVRLGDDDKRDGYLLEANGREECEFLSRLEKDLQNPDSNLKVVGWDGRKLRLKFSPSQSE